MSDSRLEKFIYAICSMDVSDLPVPLSRIEKLWNCLITGETPDFEPLSRNEKYLMAMLDRYDISNLPAPMSRGEKLLYKIAVGETDLSDVPGYLSRYEELLKYLIENGGIGFEYVLYTLNQSLNTLYTTAEKPVKSAILKGQTLVNILNYNNITISGNATYTKEGNRLTITSNAVSSYGMLQFHVKDILKNTKYIVFHKNVKSSNLPTSSTTIKCYGYYKNNRKTVALGSGYQGGNYQIIDLTNEKLDYDTITLRVHASTEPAMVNTLTVENLMMIEYQDGMENWDIPYFEGMQSVKMPVLTTTGKNLLNPLWKKEYGRNQSFKLKKGTTLTLSTKDSIPSLGGNLLFNDVSGGERWFSIDKGATKKTITLYEDVYQVKYLLTGDIEYQLEIGSVATSYEPYKTNILTVNEDVTLRRIGDVQDALDCLTGELTQRSGEVVLDGSEKWVYSPQDTYVIFALRRTDYGELMNIKQGSKIVSDRYPSGTSMNNITGGSGYVIQIFKSLNVTLEEFKNELGTNPATVQYQLATPTIKTVDLTTVDQNNQPTQLGTFKNVTYVSLESAGLIPTVEMEVATRISKELASASPLMDDISTKQEQLESTVDEQSNNVDATMIATTEIYEGTL